MKEQKRVDKNLLKNYNGLTKNKERRKDMTEERRKEIKEIVVNYAADVLKIRDSMEKKAG